MIPLHFRMLVAAIAGLVLAASSASASTTASSLTLQCDDSGNPRKEAHRIKTIGGGLVQRHSRHILLVRASGKTLTFTDQPPYDEALAGEHYEFCDRKEGFILLAYNDGMRFGGKLINERNGAVTAGGKPVMLSPDKWAYFAQVQPDGLDGSEWAIYSIDGRASWKGFDFTHAPAKADYKSANLDDQRWEADGQFTARATCATQSAITWRVKLVKHAGRWDWQPHRSCPES